MNREEHYGHLNSKKRTNETEPLIRLNVQRLAKNDFFILISETALVTQMKEKILKFLQEEEPKTESPEVSTTDLRLIYKGGVLEDTESLNFYKIQNNDTVQLCPIHRKKLDQPLSNLAGGPIENDDARNEEGKQQLVTEPGEVTIISFAIVGQPNFRGGRNLLSQNLRTSNQGPQNSASSNHASTRSSPQRRLMVPTTAAPTPVTTTGNLRNFKFVLQETLRRLSETDMNSSQELITHLDALVRWATSLRGSLTEEEKNETSGLPLETQVSNSELVISHPESIDLHSELLVPTMMRCLPLRFNMEAAPEFPLQLSNWVKNSGSSGDAESVRPNGETGNRPEQSRIFNASQILARQLLRNTTSGSIFNMIINRFNQR